jgi:Ca-activated chloride channel homolog
LAQDAGRDGRATRIVLLTDGLVELNSVVPETVARKVTRMAGQGVSLDVVDLGQDAQADPQWAAFATAGQGSVRRAASVPQLRWALREITTGQSQLLARDAQLKVTFNPKAVQEYRLLGHEAKAVAGLMPEHPQADFHAEQSASALYEVRLAANGPNDVATIELTWYRPGGKAHTRADMVRVVRTVTRQDFAATFSQAAASLQEAALVAQTAEALRRSPFARGPRATIALRRVLELAASADSRLYQRPSFHDFHTMVEQAMHAKPARGRAPRL